jgi:Uma2 family endonuclease
MSAALLLPSHTGAEALPRKRFTREEFERLIESGFFNGQRCELIDGELIDKMGQNPPHAFTIQLAHNWLASLGLTNTIRVQLPIEASAADRDRSVPEPDLSVLIEAKPEFARRFPRGDELLLAIEVADTTVGFDLSRKAALYAAAGVPEYWVLDLRHRLLVVHREPYDAGYRWTRLFAVQETVTLANRAETVRVGELLPAE